jgi:hypothetical protein
MNFIEQLLAVAPDGGNGSTEAAILTGVGLFIVYLLRRRMARRHA